MKTKQLLQLGIGLLSCIFLLMCIGVPAIFFWVSPYIAIGIVLALVSIGFMLYMMNFPSYQTNKFYRFDPVFKKPGNMRFTYRKSEYLFSCGQAAQQMLLQKHGIYMSQDEILAIAGEKTLGTTHWEIEDTLNQIFIQKGVPLIARINYYTNYAQLFDEMHKRRGVIVMFINHFNEKGFSSHSMYPHFALLTSINSSNDAEKNKVILTSPSYSRSGNICFESGRYEGEIKMSLQEFRERFYADSKFLKDLEYKPICTPSRWRNMIHRFQNSLFVFGFYIAYATKILKPGIAICIDEKK